MLDGLDVTQKVVLENKYSNRFHFFFFFLNDKTAGLVFGCLFCEGVATAGNLILLQFLELQLCVEKLRSLESSQSVKSVAWEGTAWLVQLTDSGAIV